MTFLVDGSDLRQVAFTGGDYEAMVIACDVVDEVRIQAAGTPDVKDVTFRNSIRDNLENIAKAIEMGRLPNMMDHFKAAAFRQEKFWEKTADSKLIIPEFPHHENIIWSDKEQKWTSKSGLVFAPLSSIFGPLITNPHSFEKSTKANIGFVTRTGRIPMFMEYVSERYNVDVNEIAEAGSLYCDTTVGKRAWSIANKGSIDPGQVGPEHFIAVGNAIRESVYYRQDFV